MTSLAPPKGPNGSDADGFHEASSLRDLWKSHRRTVNTSEAVYLAIRDAVAAGTIKSGEHLAEPAIAESLGISRTPIREALLRLETERLVERTVGRRLIVAEVSAEEVLDVFAVREVLNGLAARLAAERASTMDLVRMRKLQREMKWALADGDVARIAGLNYKFHEEVCAASHNEFLCQMLRQAHQTHRRYPTFSLPDRAVGSLEEHEQILQAIEARDPQRAAKLAEEHTAKAREARIAMLDGTVEELHRNGNAKESDRTGELG